MDPLFKLYGPCLSEFIVGHRSQRKPLRVSVTLWRPLVRF